MEVILLERIEKLGQMGDTVKVKDGFARNYLLPRKKALRATDANRAQFETKRIDLEATNLHARDEAQSVADKMDDVSCILIRQASEGGQLYGSVASRDIAEAVTEAGYSIDRGQVVLDRVIKVLGVHTIRIQLHPEVSVSVNINVARSAEEAETQLADAAREDGFAGASAAEPEAEADAEDLHVEEFFEEDALEGAESDITEAISADAEAEAAEAAAVIAKAEAAEKAAAKAAEKAALAAAAAEAGEAEATGDDAGDKSGDEETA